MKAVQVNHNPVCLTSEKDDLKLSHTKEYPPGILFSVLIKYRLQKVI